MIVSTDIGGTFTDYIVLQDGKIKAFKRLTTQDVAEGIKREISHAAEFHHGSTVGINALLERKGVPVVLITTEGFGTLYQIGRQNRLHIYSLTPQREKLPVDKVVEAEERTAADGKIIKELDEEELDKKLRHTRDKSAAIVFLHSYANPENEKRAKKIAEKYFDYVFASYEVRREIREYEREATTIVEAYIYPKVKDYLEKLKDVGDKFLVMQSNGGKIMPEHLKGINTLMSGPAGGVAASEYFASLLGIKNLITYDMGGTSADMGLIVDGKPIYTSMIQVDSIPIRVTSIDIISIGAGGGSIAWLDEGLSLKVGPKSAGSNPGPACYNRGGENFTVTDANLLLGILGTEISGIKLRRELAEAAAQRLGKRIGLSVEEVAEGVIRIVNNNMALAIKKITLARGYDPRDFALISFGGAGPMHACALAEEVGIKKVVVPPMAGVFSSLGILLSPIRYDSKLTILASLEEAEERIPPLIEDFERRAMEILGKHELLVTLEMRYRGQGHEITVPLTGDLQKKFEEMHHSIFGFTMDEEIEIVNVNFIATKHAHLELPKIKIGENKVKEKRIYHFAESIPVYLYTNFRECHGPCIIEAPTTTILVKEGWSARMNEYGAILMEMV